MLPDKKMLVADTKKGLLLFCDNGTLIKHLQTDENDWKWPQGMQYDAKSGRFYVSVIRHTDRAIAIFNMDLELLEFLPGPEVKSVENVCRESLALIPESGELYWSISDEKGSAIYRRHDDGQWTEIMKRAGAQYTDLKYLRTGNKGALEMLMVETKMGYCRNSKIGAYTVTHIGSES